MALALQLQSSSPVWLPANWTSTSARMLAHRAAGALVAEALLTPKPALVDRRGPGAHRDLDLKRLLRSAAALHGSFQQMAECARGREPSQSLREELARIGRNAEQAMLMATGGSNAHRGAIWVLGLLVAARAMSELSARGPADSVVGRSISATVDPVVSATASPAVSATASPAASATASPTASATASPTASATADPTASATAGRSVGAAPGCVVGAAASPAASAAEIAAIAAIAAAIAKLPDRFAPVTASNGARVCEKYGVAGARGEACEGFPHVVSIGLPALQLARSRGIGQTRARLDALMAIMASLDDTCLLHRGGRAALEAAQNGARVVLSCGGTSTAAGWTALLALDVDLLARNASPGGCADLLAACLFLDDGPTLGEVNSPWNN